MDRINMRYDDLTPKVVSNVVNDLETSVRVGALAPVPERRWLNEISNRQHSGLTYFSQAVRHPYNLIYMSGMVVAALIAGSFGLLMAALVIEAVLVCVLPTRRFFRRHVNARLAEDELVEAERQREALLFQMSEEHRRELERLEFLVHRVRNNSSHREQIKVALHESLGLDKLLASYVRLAIAHRSSRETLAMTNRRELQHKIEQLEVGCRTAQTSRMRQLHQRRKAIAERRAYRWDRNRENLEVIGQQLATIADLIHMIHEQSMTPMDVQAMNEEIDHFIAGLEENEGTLRELAAELGNEEEAHEASAVEDHDDVELLDDDDIEEEADEDDDEVISVDRMSGSRGAEAAA